MTAFLQVENLSKSFSGLRAVQNVGFTVPKGEIVGLIGPNGAGKTTCFNLIAGVYKPDEGAITLGGRSIGGWRPDQICLAGVGRTFQIVKPFAGLSVLENVIVGALKASPSVSTAREKSKAVLERLGLWHKRNQAAAELTLPERKRLEVARALATEPQILLLDEVMAGLRPTEMDTMVSVFRELNATTGLTILMIEHVMRAVMSLSKKVVVLNYGKVIATGTPEVVTRDPAVLECYLGEEAL